MALQNRTARNVKISTSLDHFVLYQRVMDKQSRDDLVEAALISYYLVCAKQDDRIPEVPGLDSVVQQQATTQPTLSPGQAGSGTGGDGLTEHQHQ